MTQEHIPAQPKNSFRITLKVNSRQPRLDALLLEAIRAQEQNDELKRISRTTFKELFKNKKILIKGQAAKPSSSVNTGTTYVDILGYDSLAAKDI